MVLQEPWRKIVVINSSHRSPPVCEQCGCELWRSPAKAIAALQGCEIQSSQWSPSLFLMSRRNYFFVFAFMSFQFVLRPVEVLNSATGPRANIPIISYFHLHVKRCLPLEACGLLLVAFSFFLIQYFASMRKVFCAASSLNVNVVHFIIFLLLDPRS